MLHGRKKVAGDMWVGDKILTFGWTFPLGFHVGDMLRSCVIFQTQSSKKATHKNTSWPEPKMCQRTLWCLQGLSNSKGPKKRHCFGIEQYNITHSGLSAPSPP